MRTSLPAATAAPVEAPRRMMRVSRPTKDDSKQKKAQEMLENHLQLIAINQQKIEWLMARVLPEKLEIEAEIARLVKVVEQDLKDSGLPGYSNGEWEAKYVTDMGRESREVDVTKLQKALKPAEFLQCVKPQIALLKQFLSEREIDGISNITPAKPGETRFVCAAVKISKPKGK
jgi:hypothetical protein